MTKLLIAALIVLTAGCSRSKATDPVASTPTKETVTEQPPQAGLIPVPHTMYNSAVEALEAVLKKTNPRVVGFGEYHQTTGQEHIQSALKRFTDVLLPALAPRSSDLIVETWVSAGNCGEQERAVVQDVDETTERPDETSNETVLLLKKARALGLKPHVLEVACDEYKKVLDTDGNVDYFNMLELVGGQLEEKATKVLAGSLLNKSYPSQGKMLLLYGGALHNDVNPHDYFKTFTYAAGMTRATGGRYIEVDLYVPEFIEQNKQLIDAPWFGDFKRLKSPNQVILFELFENSFIVVLKSDRQTLKGPKPSSVVDPEG